MDGSRLSIFILLVLNFFYWSYPSLKEYPRETVLTAFLKILPISTLILTVIQTPEVDATHAHQRKYFKLGLIFSLFGDICMNWRKDLLIPAMGVFGIAHLFYIRAFKLKPFGYEAASFCITSGFVAFMFVLPGINGRPLQIAVLFYGLLIMTTWWRAIVRWQEAPSLVNLLGAGGALTFAVSDFIIGLDTWKFPGRVPYGHVQIMATYYLAQLLLTISVTKYGWTLFAMEELREKKKG